MKMRCAGILICPSWTAPGLIENIVIYRVVWYVSGSALAAGFDREIPGASARPLTELGAVPFETETKKTPLAL